ncbi:MAG: hypothetical protein CHACPFDD_00576 [Phycisphaerae bacterium]|nr:hypothetical protein [Phycisphaerae bacterium]
MLLLPISKTAVLSLLLTSAAAQDSAARPARASSAKAAFESIRKLAGQWEGTGGDAGEPGNPMSISYRLTAGGATVVETLFRDTPHEMVTMYHLDGDALLLTHYCAAGNQPRMRLDPAASTADVLVFKFLDATNLKSPQDAHMHELKLTLVSADEIRAEWTMYVNGKPAGAKVMKVQRKK